MGIKSTLFQSFYIDSNEVIDAGERIRSAMADVDGCMEEADGLFCRISALAESVPVKARCGALISACEHARAGIKKADFLEYGNRVGQNMFELADYSEYVSNETIKRMENIRERLGGIRNTVAGLNELLGFRVYKNNLNGNLLKMQRREKMKSFSELRDIYSRQQEQTEITEFSLTYQAARYAGLQTNYNGTPIINSATDYQNYMRIMNLSLHGGTLDVVNSDGSTTTFYVCAETYEEAVNIQMDLLEGYKPTVYQGSNFVKAFREDVYNAMLPYNYMNGNEKYQFLDLSYYDCLTTDSAQKMLEGQGILEGKEKTFLKAARDNNVSPVYLIGHAMLETGHGTSDLAAGYLYEGKTVYNMYGYGAVDGNAIEAGAETAFENGWFSPEEAIIGGAEKIGKGYTGNGQSTLYEMRWNPQNPGQHQYATDIYWGLKQTAELDLKEIYNMVPSEKLHYYIPVYPAE